MKRSRKVALTLMAGTGLSLSACDTNSSSSSRAVEASHVYRSVEACAASEVYTLDQCEVSYQEALAEHEQGAPRYNTRNLCEQEFGGGSCVSRSTGSGSFWLPFFAGWAMSGIVDRSTEERDRRYYSTPIYRTRFGNDWITSSGTIVGRNVDGTYRVRRTELTDPPRTQRVQTRTTVVSRGGFASRSRGGRGSRGG